MLTIQNLRKTSHKIHVSHKRLWNHGLLLSKTESLAVAPYINIGKSPRGNGGLTIIELNTEDGEWFSGVAKCNELDAFNKKTSVKIALARLEHQIKTSRPVLWADLQKSNQPIDTSDTDI